VYTSRTGIAVPQFSVPLQQSSGTAEVYVRYKKPRGDDVAPQHDACFLRKKRQNNPEQHEVRQVIANLDAPDIQRVSGFRFNNTRW
jgi:hypothetical protein